MRDNAPDASPSLAPALAPALAAHLSAPASLTYAALSELERLLAEERERFRGATSTPFDSLDDSMVENVRVRFAGRSSPLQEWLKSLRNLPGEDRKAAGALINALKSDIEGELEGFLKRHRAYAEERRLAREYDDLTLPLPEVRLGSRHPIAVAARMLVEPLRRMGFQVVDGPEIESDFYNFEALNIPQEHPAREMQDTFFLASEWVLRTQTSTMQVHAMMERGVPLKIACPGYTYRNEYDMTHVPTFRQIEGLVVDKGITLAHMRHTLSAFFSEIFGRPVKLRLRSSYFPFTEPSAEMDVECQQCFGAGCRSCKHTGWLELGGCGLINRNVLLKCGIDPDVYSGFAFGMGIDRIAMSRFAVSDLRAMYEGDVPFLADFRLS
jgi:phenylalanyl-tRNA synthetase alpha chain